MMEIIRWQFDDEDVNLIYLLIGGVATDGHYHLARLEAETDDPPSWLRGHEIEAQAAIDIGQLDLTREVKIDFDALADKAAAEIEWLDETIPNIPTMTGTEVRDVVLRLAREQREELKAWRYIFRRLN